MLSRKSKDKTIKEGVVGKYVKKETPPEIPSKFSFIASQIRLHFEIFDSFLV